MYTVLCCLIKTNKRLPPTHATINLGIRLNGKIGLYFGSFGKTENKD